MDEERNVGEVRRLLSTMLRSGAGEERGKLAGQKLGVSIKLQRGGKDEKSGRTFPMSSRLNQTCPVESKNWRTAAKIAISTSPASFNRMVRAYLEREHLPICKIIRRTISLNDQAANDPAGVPCGKAESDRPVMRFVLAKVMRCPRKEGSQEPVEILEVIGGDGGDVPDRIRLQLVPDLLR